MGTLTVTRKAGGWRDRARAYTLEVDGVAVGKVGNGKTVSVALSPGSHRVQLRIDWCASPVVIVDGGRDEKLVCEPGGNSLMALIDVLFRPGDYINLERAR